MSATSKSASLEVVSKFDEPETKHSIADRVALTGDALKLGKHELKKEFTKRINILTQAIDDAWKSTLPLRDAYNMAVASCALSVAQPVVDGIRSSFALLNNMIPDRRADEDPDEYNTRLEESAIEVDVRVSTCGTFFRGSKKGEAACVERLGILAPVRRAIQLEHGYMLLSHMREIVNIEYVDDLSYEQTIELDIEINHGTEGESMELTRELIITCDQGLYKAREAFVEPVKTITDLEERLKVAESDLENLPKMMEELDMSATAMRLKAAGGAQFLGHIMAGVLRIKGGETELSGLQLAMEDAPAAEGN
jgi:hypothetical protein